MESFKREKKGRQGSFELHKLIIIENLFTLLNGTLQSIPVAPELGTIGDDVNIGIGPSSSFELMVTLLTPVGIIDQASVMYI